MANSKQNPEYEVGEYIQLKTSSNQTVNDSEQEHDMSAMTTNYMYVKGDYLDIHTQENVSYNNHPTDKPVTLQKSLADVDDLKCALKKCIIIMTFLLVLLLLMTVAAIALATFSCIAVLRSPQNINYHDHKSIAVIEEVLYKT